MSELLSLVVSREFVQVEEEKYFTVSTEIRFGEEKTEMILKEKLRKPKEMQRTVNIPLPRSERDDDWFVLLDASPRQTPYVPPGILISYFNLDFLSTVCKF